MSLTNDYSWAQIVAKAWADEEFMRQLMADPGKVLTQNGYELPEGTRVIISEHAPILAKDIENHHFLTIPKKPSTDEMFEEIMSVGEYGATNCSGCGSCSGCYCSSSCSVSVRDAGLETALA